MQIVAKENLPNFLVKIAEKCKDLSSDVVIKVVAIAGIALITSDAFKRISDIVNARENE